MTPLDPAEFERSWRETLPGSRDGEALSLLGHCPTEPWDRAGTGTLFMFGPGPKFWPEIKSAPEWGSDDPVDDWSARVLGYAAERAGGRAYFPFGGPPWHPFYTWALRTGRCHVSPVGFLVHDTQGLMVSFRGAILLPGDLPPRAGASPCPACDQPCRGACPPRALTEEGYDVPRCHAFLDSGEGDSCLSAGCLARRACPLSRGAFRDPEQSAHHMERFHR